MSRSGIRQSLGVALLGLLAGMLIYQPRQDSHRVPPNRREVVFWHFWGGRHRAVVEEIVARFNASQHEHFVRAIAMPGANLDLKFFLSVTGGDPPDLLNHDDPVVADWAYRGAIQPLSKLTTPDEYARLENWLFPTARALGTYDGKLYALCNGLDIRALYYDKTLLDRLKLQPPKTLAELDALALRITPVEKGVTPHRYGFLPDPRRIWAWGIVFGGRFYDPPSGRITANSQPIVRALDWMASYSRRYGARAVAAFRKGDQALAGASFPLLEGRYAMLMDGQWRVPEIVASRRAARRDGRPAARYGVVPLPPPPGGRENAGWVNGNFFVVPRGAHNPEGAWAFAKFWSGFDGHEPQAARHCAAGGWIPASQQVVAQAEFQRFLEDFPQFATFVALASSEQQIPTPVVPGAMYFYTQIVRAAEDAMYRGKPPREALDEATERVRRHLRELTVETR